MPKTGEVDLQKLKYWKAVMADFRRSGLSGKEYCRRRGISYAGFAERRRALAASTLPDNSRTSTPTTCRTKEGNAIQDEGFAELTVKEQVIDDSEFCSERLEVVFPSGTILRVPPGYSSNELVKIITSLECQ